MNRGSKWHFFYKSTFLLQIFCCIIDVYCYMVIIRYRYVEMPYNVNKGLKMKIKVNLKRYGLYLFRWQLSTPILALVLVWLADLGKLAGTIVANFIGGLIFFWVDRFIFTSSKLGSQWQVADKVQCGRCGKTARGYRLVKTKNYDRISEPPVFLCEECSIEKTEQLRLEGVSV